MTAIHTITGALSDADRGARIFAGDLVIFRGGAALGRFRDRIAELIEDAFGDHEPEGAQFALSEEDYLERVARLRKRVRGDDEARLRFREALTELGANAAETYLDWIHLRVLPDGHGHQDPGTSRLGFHRDTWSSNLYAQTNWWTPIYPLTPERSLAFYPAYWSAELANSSERWDLDDVRRHRDGPTPQPLVPEPTAEVDTSGELRIVPHPGDLLCFSGAHVHATVPNTSGRARFSIEVRTVNASDLAAGRGAPNVDGRAPHTPYHWFTHILDGTPLSGSSSP